MSGGVSNFGMGFEPQRNASTVIQSPQEIMRDQMAQAAAQQAALAANAPQAPQSTESFLSGLIGQRANQLATEYGPMDGTVSADSLQKMLTTNVGNWLQGQGSQSYGFQNLLGADLAKQYTDYAGNSAGFSGGIQTGTTTPGVWQQQQGAYQQQLADNNSAMAASNAAAQAAAGQGAGNQALQQQAYGQQTGSGFNGGILNSSYSQPFGNTLGFSGGMMGGSGAAATPSTGLTPFGTGGASAGQQAASPQGWGGPFSAKNPWSLG